jgi:hypothetical protein
VAVDLVRMGGMNDEPQVRVVYCHRVVQPLGKHIDYCLELSRTAR